MSNEPTWEPASANQACIRAVARELLIAEGKRTQPDDTLLFMDPFNWEGRLPTRTGMHRLHEIAERRPAWTAPRIIRMANAAILALQKQPT